MGRNEHRGKHKNRSREQWNRYTRACLQKLKDTVIAGYGGKCSCCGEDNRKFLTLDHVASDGNEERKTMAQSTIYRKARDAGFPPEYQVLCFNCNCGRNANSGVCPHKENQDG